ncbi:MAG TPA: hypothetical protein VMV68_05670 [Spirochaetia bacterium]|nr:hypothetical protein [Spirochaetia bacterium]
MEGTIGAPGLIAYLVWVGWAWAAAICGIALYVAAPAEAGHEGAPLPEQSEGMIFNSLGSELSHARSQQWNVGYLALLLLAAIAALSLLPQVKGVAVVSRWVLPILADCVWGTAAIGLLTLQRSQQKARIRRNRIGLLQRRAHYWISDDDYEGWQTRNERFAHRFTRPLLMLGMLTITWLFVEYLIFM